MEALGTVITILLVVASVLMIAVVLMQKSKSAGMGSAFGSDSQSFTTKGRAASRDAKLKKITVYLAIAIGVLALVLAVIRK